MRIISSSANYALTLLGKLIYSDFMQMTQIYEWGDPTELIDSPRFGAISYREWLEKEKANIEASPGRKRVAEIRMWGEWIGLFVNDIGDRGSLHSVAAEARSIAQVRTTL